MGLAVGVGAGGTTGIVVAASNATPSRVKIGQRGRNIDGRRIWRTNAGAEGICGRAEPDVVRRVHSQHVFELAGRDGARWRTRREELFAETLSRWF